MISHNEFNLLCNKKIRETWTKDKTEKLKEYVKKYGVSTGVSKFQDEHSSLIFSKELNKILDEMAEILMKEGKNLYDFLRKKDVSLAEKKQYALAMVGNRLIYVLHEIAEELDKQEDAESSLLNETFNNFTGKSCTICNNLFFKNWVVIDYKNCLDFGIPLAKLKNQKAILKEILNLKLQSNVSVYQILNSNDFKDYFPEYVKNIDKSEICPDCVWQARSIHGINKDYIKHTYKLSSKKDMINAVNNVYKLMGLIPSFQDICQFSISHKYDEKGNLYKNRDVLSIQDFQMLIQSIYVLARYKENYDSWFALLVDAGIFKEGVRRLPRGTICLAEDGHTCLSIAEKTIDDWMFRNKIKHEKEPKYPRNKDINPKQLLRADWKVGKIYIEYFGLKGNIDYDEKILLKKELVVKAKLELIEIYHKDLKDLNKKIKIK